MTERKKSNLLNRSTPAEPKTTYTRDNIFSVSDNKKVPESVVSNRRGKRTSISCFQDTKNKIQSLMTIMDVKNADEALDKLIDSYLDIMENDELTEYKYIVKTLDKRTIRR